MKKRQKSGGKPVRLKKVLSTAEIDKVLDDLDKAMLSGDEKRMESLIGQLPEENDQVAEIITRRIVDGSARVPIFAFEMLGIFGGSQTEDYFKRIAEDRAVDDLTRFGARRFLGWPEEGGKKRRREFLEIMKDAGATGATLIEAVDQANAAWPSGIDVMEEALGYLEALPGPQRQALLARIVAELGIKAIWLLKAAIHIPHEKTQLFTLAELVKLRPAWAGAELERLAKTARTEKLHDAATAARQRLSLQLVDSTFEKSPPFLLPPVDRVLMSEIDGEGGQVIFVVRRWDEGAYMFADIFHSDGWGVKTVFGSDRAVPDHVEDLLAGLEVEDISMVEVDIAAARGAVAAAIEVNAETGNPLPPNYALWELLLHDEYPPRAGEQVILPELDDSPYVGRSDLLRSSGQLADHPFFASWPFEHYKTSAAMTEVPPPSGGRLTDKQFKPLIEQLVDARTAATLRGRLRRQAWLLERAGDVKELDMALAVAAQLATASLGELVKQPFLRAIVQRSVELVVMATSEMDL